MNAPHRLARTLGTLPGRLAPRLSPRRMAAEAARYWRETDSREVRVNAHWRGEGAFADTERWSAIGRRHVALFERLANAEPDGVVLEWGCGGGTNVVAFGRRARRVYGVDVAERTLDEAAARAAEAGIDFTAVLADVDDPEAATGGIEPIDLFVCTYVLELVPSRAHGARILRTAHALLRDGGLALVQFRYAPDGVGRDGRRRYRDQVAGTTRYGLEEFWTLAGEIGLCPEVMHLVPLDALVDDRHYAYVLMRKASLTR